MVSGAEMSKNSLQTNKGKKFKILFKQMLLNLGVNERIYEKTAFKKTVLYSQHATVAF